MYQIAHQRFTKVLVVFLLTGTFLYLLFGTGLHMHSMAQHPDVHDRAHVFVHSHSADQSSHHHDTHHHQPSHDHVVHALDLLSPRPHSSQTAHSLQINRVAVFQTMFIAAPKPDLDLLLLALMYRDPPDPVAGYLYSTTFQYRGPPLL